MTGAILSLVIMYSTVRRSTLYFSLIGLLFYFYLLKKKYLGWIISLTVVIFLTTLVSPVNTKPKEKEVGFFARSDLIFEGLGKINFRLSNIAVGMPLFWFQQKPFGSFLGYAGKEAAFDNVPKSVDINAVEIGAAQLIAETGLLGLLFYILVLTLVWKGVFSCSINSKFRDSIIMLFIGNASLGIMFLMQMDSIQYGMYISHIVFWAMPGIAWALIKSESKSIQYEH
jgi:O-antigen ligase